MKFRLGGRQLRKIRLSGRRINIALPATVDSPANVRAWLAARLEVPDDLVVGEISTDIIPVRPPRGPGRPIVGADGWYETPTVIGHILETDESISLATNVIVVTISLAVSRRDSDAIEWPSQIHPNQEGTETH